MQNIIANAKTLFNNKDFEGALSKVLELNQNDPENSKWWFVLGKIFYNKGDIAGSEKYFRKAVELKPESYIYTFTLNAIRIRHYEILPKDRPRILIAGAVSLRYALERAFRSFADVINCMPGNPEESRYDLLKYRQDLDNFDDFSNRIPKGWDPDCLIWMFPEWNNYPQGIEKCPFLTVGIHGDRPTASVKMMYDLHYFDINTAHDEEGVNIFRKWGFENVLNILLWSYIEKDIFSFTDEKKRDLDVVFFGGFDRCYYYPTYHLRDSVLRQVLSLSDKYNILIRHPYPDPSRWVEKNFNVYEPKFNDFDDEEPEFMSDNLKKHVNELNRSKISIVANAIKQIHPIMFEGMCCGAVEFVEDFNNMVPEYFKPDKEVVLYNEDNLKERLVNYLENNKEREEVSEAGRKSVEGYSPTEKAKEFYDLIQKTNKEFEKKSIKKRTILQFSEAEQFNIYGEEAYYVGILGLAQKYFEKALSLDPFSAKIFNNLGVISLIYAIREPDPDIKKGYANTSLNYLQRALMLQDSYLRALYNIFYLKLMVFEDGFLEERQKYLNLITTDNIEILKTSDLGVFFYRNLAANNLWEKVRSEICLLQSTYPEKGLEFYVRTSGTLGWQIEVEIAEFFLKQNIENRALNALKNALNLIPYDSFSAFRIAHIYMKNKRYDDALKYINISIKSQPLKIDSYNLKMMVLRLMGDEAGAVAFAKDTATMLKGLGEDIFKPHLEKYKDYLSNFGIEV